MLRLMEAKLSFLAKVKEKSGANNNAAAAKVEQDILNTLAAKLPSYFLSADEAAQIMTALAEHMDASEGTCSRCMDLLTEHTSLGRPGRPIHDKPFNKSEIVQHATGQSCLHFGNYLTKHEVDCLRGNRILDENKIILLALLALDIGLVNPNERTKQCMIGVFSLASLRQRQMYALAAEFRGGAK